MFKFRLKARFSVFKSLQQTASHCIRTECLVIVAHFQEALQNQLPLAVFWKWEKSRVDFPDSGSLRNQALFYNSN